MSQEDLSPLLSCPFHVEGASPFTVIHNQPAFPAFVNFSYQTNSTIKSTQKSTSSSDNSDVTIDINYDVNSACKPDSKIKTRLNIMQLKGEVKKQLDRGHLTAASMCLEKLLQLQDNDRERYKTAVLLCDTYCNMEDITRAINTMKLIEEYVKYVDISANKMSKIAECEIYQKNFFKAFIYYVSEAEIHISNSSFCVDPNRPLTNIMNCVEKMRYLVLCFKNDISTVCSDFIFSILMEIYRKSSMIKGKSRTDHTLYMAWLLYYIASCHAELKQYNKSIAIINDAVSLMEKYMHETASSHKLYAFCMHNLGFACYQVADFSGSVLAYQRALTACVGNSSWPEDKVKRVFLVLTKHELKKAKYFRKRPKLLKYLKFPDYLYLRCSGVV